MRYWGPIFSASQEMVGFCCFGTFAIFLPSTLTNLKEVLMPVLSRACPELVLSEVEGRSRRVEGLIAIN